MCIRDRLITVSSPPITYTAYPVTFYSNVWLGKGDGTFRARTSTSHTENVIWWIVDGGMLQQVFQPSNVYADFNRDGIADYASFGWDGFTPGAFVSLGSGNGIFQPAQRYDAGPAPTAIGAGDVNGDGQIDLIVVNYGSPGPTFEVLLNDGQW